MDNHKDDAYYIDKITTDLMFIVKHTRNITINELYENEILLDSMLFRLIQISENSKKLSEVYKQNHEMIPWNAMNGFRNRIVHDYGSVELEVVFDTLVEDIPDLLKMILNR